MLFSTISNLFCSIKDFVDVPFFAKLTTSTSSQTYAIVKQWIQGYIRQMELNIWPFIGVFMGLLLVVIISIYWRVWKAANENPAEVVKSE